MSGAPFHAMLALQLDMIGSLKDKADLDPSMHCALDAAMRDWFDSIEGTLSADAIGTDGNPSSRTVKSLREAWMKAEPRMRAHGQVTPRLVRVLRGCGIRVDAEQDGGEGRAMTLPLDNDRGCVN